MTSPAAAPTLAATTRLGATHLTVSDLDRSVRFYQDAIGLRVHSNEDGRAALASGPPAQDVLVLVEEPGAARAGRHAGRYHVALLYPSREELAFAVDRLIRTRTPVEGMSDHGTHEAIYLPDPDGNGLELAADRPREQWPADWGDLRPQPLDMHGLIRSVAGEPPARHADPGLAVGHLHLHVGDVEHGLAFYRDVLGFEVQALLPSAAFVSGGGYHHHLGFNVWRGPGVPPAPAGAVGLREWTVALPEEGLAEVLGRLDAAGVPHDGGLAADPWGNAIRFVAA
jgi:catechol 2,3-dioxygenase